jgi:hypothetical protein
MYVCLGLTHHATGLALCVCVCLVCVCVCARARVICVYAWVVLIHMVQNLVSDHFERLKRFNGL